MKRWDYNTLRGEVVLFFIFLSLLIFEVLAVFYILFFAEPVCAVVADKLHLPECFLLLVWVSRVLAVFYMVLAWYAFRYVNSRFDSL